MRGKRSLGRSIEDKYYDITSMFRGAKIRHGERMLPGKYSLLRILDAWAFLMFARNWPKGDAWDLYSVQALALILGILVLDAVASRVPFAEILDALSSGANALTGKWARGESLFKKKTVTETSETTTKTLPTEGGVTE